MTKPVLAATVAAAVLAAPAAAQAHVTLNPREVTAGAFTVMTVRVPNERDNKGTVKVDVRFPDGFYSLSYKKVAGLEGQDHAREARHARRARGPEDHEQISRVVWTGNPKKGGIIKPDQFEEFPISVQVPEGEAGSFLTFRAFQTYRGGERVRWTGAPESGAPRAAGEAARRRVGAGFCPGRPLCSLDRWLTSKASTASKEGPDVPVLVSSARACKRACTPSGPIARLAS